jgi:hypothetical protein
VPLLRSIAIDNTNGTELSSLSVELTASPAFACGKRWTVDRIGAGEKLTLKEVDLDVDPAYLDSLDEAERGVLTFSYCIKAAPSMKHAMFCECSPAMSGAACPPWGTYYQRS